MLENRHLSSMLLTELDIDQDSAAKPMFEAPIENTERKVSRPSRWSSNERQNNSMNLGRLARVSTNNAKKNKLKISNKL